jgi:hypothetical protein
MWKGMDAAGRRKYVQNQATWAKIPFRSYNNNLQRAFIQARGLDYGRKSDAPQVNRWLTALYDETYKPGSWRNPVLVDGTPPLTQQLADRYRDYMEVMLDLSVSGGFTEEQRRTLQDYLVKDWKQMTAEDRDALLGDLKTWSDATAGGSPAEANKVLPSLRAKVLARLNATRDEPGSRWSLGLVKQERQKFEVLSDIQRQLYETQMKIAHNIEPQGSWHYNGLTGDYEWVPEP